VHNSDAASPLDLIPEEIFSPFPHPDYFFFSSNRRSRSASTSLCHPRKIFSPPFPSESSRITFFPLLFFFYSEHAVTIDTTLGFPFPLVLDRTIMETIARLMSSFLSPRKKFLFLFLLFSVFVSRQFLLEACHGQPP